MRDHPVARLMRQSGRVLRLVALYPRFVRLWTRAIECRDDGDWLALAQTMTKLAENGWGTDDSNLLHGYALLQLGDSEGALARLGMIKNELPDIGDEAKRWTCSAIALRNLGRVTESRELIASKRVDRWPQGEKERAILLLDSDSS